MSGVLLALFGTTLFSTGVILQKKGAGWMAWKDKINARFISTFFLWLIGMLLSYAISAIPMGMASGSLPPHVVSAVTGWSIVVIVFLSNFFLKEKLHTSDAAYSVLIVLCILLLGRFEGMSHALSMNTGHLYTLLFAPFVLLIPVFFRFTGLKQKVILLSVFSGFLGGLTLVFMNILVKESGGSLSGIVSSANLYIYFAAGIVSVAAKQAAYRLGDVILITPLQTSFSMIYPLLCSYLLYHASIAPAQVLLVLLIVLCCWGIQKKR